MKFGYACINTTNKLGFKTCRLKTAQTEGLQKVKEITINNFNVVLNNLKWNIDNNIFFYRMSSDIVPFSTHPIMKDEFQWKWYEDEDVLVVTNQIKDFVALNNIRLSVHPAQYSPLSTFNPDVLSKTFEDFEYHDKLLTLTGGNDMITHVGGMYGDREKAKSNFVKNYNLLSDSIKQKLRLENDDKTFTVEDVLDINQVCGVPICLDIHHHNCNPCQTDIRELFPKIIKTWEGFGKPKTHISTGKTHQSDRSHADYISRVDLEDFLNIIGGYDVDIMFEAKKKELSVLELIDLQK